MAKPKAVADFGYYRGGCIGFVPDEAFWVNPRMGCLFSVRGTMGHVELLFFSVTKDLFFFQGTSCTA